MANLKNIDALLGTISKSEKNPSGFRHRDSNSRPNDLELTSITTRPGLSPNMKKINYYSLTIIYGGKFIHRIRHWSHCIYSCKFKGQLLNWTSRTIT